MYALRSFIAVFAIAAILWLSVFILHAGAQVYRTIAPTVTAGGKPPTLRTRVCRSERCAHLKPRCTTPIEQDALFWVCKCCGTWHSFQDGKMTREEFTEITGGAPELMEGETALPAVIPELTVEDLAQDN